MKLWRGALCAIALLLGCGGGGGADEDTSQAIAKQWIAAAVGDNLVEVRHLTVDAYDQQAMDMVKFIQEAEFSVDHIGWAAGGELNGVYEWSAANGAQIVTMKLRSDGAGSYQVFEISLSW